MASGFGYTGGRSRCHPFWQEFVQCYQKADEPAQCAGQRADYLECLHHSKEVKRAQIVKSHYLQTQKHELAKKKQEAEEAAAPGGVMSLNLIALNNQEEAANGSGGGQQSNANSRPGEKAPKEGKQQAS